MSTITTILPTPPNGFSTQISTSSVSSSDLSIELDSTSGLGAEGVGQLLKKDADGNLVAGSVEFVHWTNVSGNTITFSDTGDRGITGSDSGAQSYVADDYFEVWVSSYYTPSGIREQINDTNKNELIKFSATASAVNEITVTNAATGNAPEISATGGDTNIDLKLTAKGTGAVVASNPLELKDATTSTGDGEMVYDRTNEKLLVGDGTNTQAIQTGAWTSYDPTLTNITVGNGTKDFYYCVMGKTVHFRGNFKLGNTSSVSGAIGISLPVTAKKSGNAIMCRILDSGTSSFVGMVYFVTTTRLDLWCQTVSTYVTWTSTSGTAPMTWTTNDEFFFDVTYEAA